MELTQEYFDQQLKNLATKDDLKNFVTKDDLLELATKQDFNALKSIVDDIQEKVTRIDTRDLEDSNAFAKDITKLQDRVSTIERQLKLKHA